MRVFLLSMVVLLAAAPALPQLGEAGLYGSITSEDGAALAGALVTVRSVATGTVRRATTSEDGTYVVTAVSPGSYTVTFDLEGFRSVQFARVELRLGQTTALSGVMKLASVRSTIAVTARAHVLDLHSRHVGDTLTDAEFRNLPTQNRSFLMFAALVPGVVPNPQTNSSGNEALYINGQHQQNNSFRVDGARNDDDVVGSLGGAQVRTALEAIQEFQILTTQYDAEFGGATGGVLNAITKRGTNEVRGSAFAFVQQATWNEQDYFGERAELPPPDSDFRAIGFTVGGWIRRDRAHYFASFEHIEDHEGHTRVFGARPELSYSTTESNEVRNILARFDVQLTTRQHASFRYLREDAPQRNKIVGTQTASEGAREEHDADQNWIAGIESIFSENAVNSLRVSYTQEHLVNAASPFGQWASDFDALRNVGPLLDRPSVDEGPSVLGLDQRSHSIDVADTLSALVRQGRTTHELRAGFQWARRTIDNQQFGSANGSFEFDTDRAFNPDDVTTYPVAFTARLHGPARAVATESEMLGLFVQDDYHVGPNLTLAVGLRWDREDVVSDDDNIAPRLGVVWSPGSSARSVVRGGFGRFYGHFPLAHWSLFQLDAVQLTEGFLVRLPDAGADRQFFFDLARANQVTSLAALRDLLIRTLEGQTTSQLNASPTVDHEDRVQPYVDTVTLGGDRELFGGVAVGFDLVYSENKDTLILVDLNPFSRALGGRPNMSIRDGKVVPMGSINTLMNAGTSRYRAVQLSVRKRMDGRVGGRVSYTYSESDGNYGNAAPLGFPNTAYFQTRSETGYNFDTGEIIGEPLRLNLDDPRNDGQPVGWHRGHNLVVSGIWAVPRTAWRGGGGLAVSWLYRYLRGDRFTIFTTQLLDNGNRSPAPRGTYDATVPSEVGLTGVPFSGTMFGAENPDFSRLDLSLRYAIPIRHREMQLTLIGDVFNATNRTNFVNGGSTIYGSAGFLTPTATFSPREFQLGARLSF